MLMIGATGRRRGESDLACAVIRKLVGERTVVGVKVTTVHETAGPHTGSGDGSGTDRSPSTPLRLIEGRGDLEGKDTARLLESGARPVYWLRVRASHLASGARLLSQRLGPEAIAVCQSNSLRRAVEPGLFVMVHRQGIADVKPSCRELSPLADLLMRFDGERFDVSPEEFRLVEGRWTVRRRATAIVLAGGRSTRMGRDKTLLPVAGRPMIERVVSQLRPHFSQILISADDAAKFQFLGLEVVPDRIPGEGPMMAVASALERSENDINFVVACDIPVLPTDLLMRLLRDARGNADVVVPVTAQSRYEPLFAVYRKRVKPLLDRALDHGGRRIVTIFDACRTRTVRLGEGEGPSNVNTIADYETLAGTAE
jgi:molybdopterin-guanine dinucleotide biosynthesis protein A